MGKTLPQRLRDLRAAARPHFQPHDPDGTPRPAAFSIVATEARLQDLLDAASELEAQQRAEDRKTVQRLQGWIEQEEAAANAEEVASIAEQLRGGPAMVAAEPAGELQLVSWQTFDDQNLGRQQQRFDEAMLDLSAIIQQRARLAYDLVASLEDNAIRAKLVELGWTPPGEVLTHDQVREAALAELATWDQAAPGGPTAYEVAHSICRRLGVVL